MVTKSQLIGYVRKDRNGSSLRISIDREAFMRALSFNGLDGREFVSLICNADKVGQILNGEREVTSLCQLIEQEDDRKEM